MLGFAVGGASQTVPMYTAELAPRGRRGRLVLTFQVAIGAGILVATLMGASELLHWRTAIALGVVPSALLFVLMLPLPESPRWLVKQGRVDEARATLQRIRGRDEVKAELAEIVALEEREHSYTTRGLRGLFQPWVRPALLVGCGVAMFTQLSGIEMIIYYTPTILTDAG